MKFVLVWNIKKAEKDGRNNAIHRFLEAGGLPPAGATLLARYVRADFMGGFNIVESEDARALMGYALDWTDLLDAEYYPVIEDDDLTDILTTRFKS